MNQVAGSKAGRCLLLTRRDHVRHPLSLPPPFLPYILARKPPLPSGFGPKLLLYRSRLEYLGNLPFSLAHHLLFVAFHVTKLAIIARENNARSPARTSRWKFQIPIPILPRISASCAVVPLDAKISTRGFDRRSYTVCVFDPCQRVIKFGHAETPPLP